MVVHNASMTDSSERRDADLAAALALKAGSPGAGETGSDEAARVALLNLSARYPDDVEIAYQTAAIHDRLGLEAEAVPFYQAALSRPGLSEQDRHDAFVGFGSTYRVLGRYSDALATLRRGLEEFPGDPVLRTFLAMVLYNVGDHADAVGALLKVLAETSADRDVQSFRRAIEFYADNLDLVM
jgi:tetratricopeptide (TPR) repeat protein